MHLIVRPEEPARDCHDLSVGRMIERLDGRDTCRELRVKFPDVRGQFVFGASGTGDQHRPASIERL